MSLSGSPERAAGAPLPAGTRAWVQEQLRPGEHIAAITPLRGGWTSQIRRLDVAGPLGERSLVLRCLVLPFFLTHAEELLGREAQTLELLAPTQVPVPGLIALDARAQHCEHPSLLTTFLPGSVRLDDAGADRRAGLLASELLRIHRVTPPERIRPRSYQPWTTAGDVQAPSRSTRPRLWRRAVELIDREPPEHTACFLHRDFHPGNVLFDGHGAQLRISGVVDWVETSWGPADLDVAHCSTNLALLHGIAAGMTFAERYVTAGGSLAQNPGAHLYWRLLDALAFAPAAEQVAEPWRELGRTDLSDQLVAARLEDYIEALLAAYGQR